MSHVLRVAIAEDDPNMRDLVAAVLRDAGYEVIEADDGRELLDTLATCRPDLVVTDIQMPNVDGIEVLEALQGAVPVVVMTAVHEDAMRKKAVAYGAKDIVDKPFDVDELRAKIGGLLASQR